MEYRTFLIIALLIYYSNMSESLMKLTNLECVNLADDIGVLHKCFIEPLSPGSMMTGVSAEYELLKPLDNGTVTLTLMKKTNGWKKFLYDVKNADICKLLAGKDKNQINKYIFGYIKKYSNLEKCPFNKIVVSKLTFSENDTQLIPLPVGEYALFTEWYFNGVHALSVKGYLRYTNYRKNK